MALSADELLKTLKPKRRKMTETGERAEDEPKSTAKASTKAKAPD